MSGATLDEATTLAEQGTILMSRGNYADALVIYDRCLSIQLAHLGDMHPMVSHTVDLMGVALLRIGNAGEAMEVISSQHCTSLKFGFPFKCLIPCSLAYSLSMPITFRVSTSLPSSLNHNLPRT